MTGMYASSAVTCCISALYCSFGSGPSCRAWVRTGAGIIDAPCCVRRQSSSIWGVIWTGCWFMFPGVLRLLLWLFGVFRAPFPSIEGVGLGPTLVDQLPMSRVLQRATLRRQMATLSASQTMQPYIIFDRNAKCKQKDRAAFKEGGSCSR